MAITKLEIRNCLLESLRAMLTDGPDTPITDQTDPIGNLGLDSVDGILVAATISEKLEFNIPSKLNPFVDDGPPCRVRRIGEIVNCLHDLATRQEEKSHAQR